MRTKAPEMNVTDPSPELDFIIKELAALGNPKDREGMARFGIKSENAFGIRLPVLRSFAKMLRGRHDLALDLWWTKIHEAMLLAIFIADRKLVTEELMENWLMDFDSWDICDQACSSLFVFTRYAYQKAIEWPERTAEFEKRAGFVMIAALAVHDKKAPDESFFPFLSLIEKHAGDSRNFVKKAVNWALRQIGKRNLALNHQAMAVAEKIKRQDSSSAKWIAADALRELTSPAVQARLERKK